MMIKATKVYAFPQPGYYGMSLRDYFAAKAMQGMQSNFGANDWSVRKFAERAYEMADAMMKAREE